MTQQQCSSCSIGNSIYGNFCNECQSLGLLPSGGHVQMQRKKKTNILSTLDILISVFVVTPLVVACWRGTWQLMDIYADYFPPVESFIIGTLIHIVIGISQESFNGIVNRKHKSWLCNTFACLFMKLYTIVLNAVTNMHWRGGWIIVDKYFGIGPTETDEFKIQNVRGAVCFFAICFLIMFSMRCLRNLNSPPFGICLDYGDDMFLFPNMFKVNPLQGYDQSKNVLEQFNLWLYESEVLMYNIYGLHLEPERRITQDATQWSLLSNKRNLSLSSTVNEFHEADPS